MLITVAAVAGAWVCGLAIIMQIGLAAGMPWGEYANGGRFPGKLPPAMRLAAVVQGSILVFVALALLDRGGVFAIGLPAWAFWVALSIACLTCVANWITPSRKERYLWGPLLTILAAGAVFLALAVRPAAAALAPDYVCPSAQDISALNANGVTLGAGLYKLSSARFALYPLAPPRHILRLETSNLFGSGFRQGPIYFYESSEGAHYLLVTSTGERIACEPNPASSRSEEHS